MSYQQDPNALTGGVPNDEAFIHALARILAKQNAPAGHIGGVMNGEMGFYGPRGHFVPTAPMQHALDPDQAAAEQAYEQDAAAAQQQYGMMDDGSPLAPLAAEGMQGLTAEAPATVAPKAKKKGEFSHFFQLLKQAKTEGKGGATSKAFKDLAKQLEKESDPTAAPGGTVAVS